MSKTYQVQGGTCSPRKHYDSKKVSREEREKELIHNASLKRFPDMNEQVAAFLSYKLIIGTRYVPHDLLVKLFQGSSFSFN